MSARTEQREATLEQIKTVARELMTEQGASGLSIRAIARVMEMTPPALYRYFDSLHALITALLVENYYHLAEALEQAAAQDAAPLARLTAFTLAYREWARAHPVDFQLLYGTPIPGYDAPTELTVPAAARGYYALVQLLDTFPPDPALTMPPTTQAYIAGELLGNMPAHPQSHYRASAIWAHMHGLVMLEQSGHLPSIVGDNPAFFRMEMARTFAALGLT